MILSSFWISSKLMALGSSLHKLGKIALISAKKNGFQSVKGGNVRRVGTGWVLTCKFSAKRILGILGA